MYRSVYLFFFTLLGQGYSSISFNFKIYDTRHDMLSMFLKHCFKTHYYKLQNSARKRRYIKTVIIINISDLMLLNWWKVTNYVTKVGREMNLTRANLAICFLVIFWLGCSSRFNSSNMDSEQLKEFFYFP